MTTTKCRKTIACKHIGLTGLPRLWRAGSAKLTSAWWAGSETMEGANFGQDHNYPATHASDRPGHPAAAAAQAAMPGPGHGGDPAGRPGTGFHQGIPASGEPAARPSKGGPGRPEVRNPTSRIRRALTRNFPSHPCQTRLQPYCDTVAGGLPILDFQKNSGVGFVDLLF